MDQGLAVRRVGFELASGVGVVVGGSNGAGTVWGTQQVPRTGLRRIG